MRYLWRNYSLGIVLFALFLGSWVVQTVAGWREFAAEQASHGQAVAVLGDGGYACVWARTTFESVTSEFLQLFAMVVLTAYFIFKGSTESKDGQERMQASLDRIERRGKVLEAHRNGLRSRYGRVFAGVLPWLEVEG